MVKDNIVSGGYLKHIPQSFANHFIIRQILQVVLSNNNFSHGIQRHLPIEHV